MGKNDWAAKQVAERFQAANERGRRAAASEPRAKRVRYDVTSSALHLDLTNGAAISIPVRLIPGLRAATTRQLHKVEILPGGDGLHWEALDFTISVPALVAGLFGPGTWMAELGRRGGARSSAAKAAAARRNGLRGGRPPSRP
jgi:Protein of unknown function (DUF2442)